MTSALATRADAILAVDKTMLEQSRATAEQVKAKLANFPNTTPEHEQSLADFLARTKEQLRVLEEERETLVRPLIDDKAEIDKLYRAPRTAWEAVEKLIKGKLAAAQESRRLAAETAKAEAIKAAQAGKTEECAAALAVAAEATAKPKVEGISTRWEWTYEVVNLEAIPRDFLEVSKFRVKCHLDAYKSQEAIPEVPGLKFTRVAKVVAR